jgi:hypothetical protein
MSEARAFTNVKTRTRSSVTGKETMQHHPVGNEITFPASDRVEKEQSYVT